MARKKTARAAAVEHPAQPSETAPVDPRIDGNGVFQADNPNHPAWTRWVWSKFGYLGGYLVFLLFILLVWPLGIALAGGVIILVASLVITSVPGMVLSALGVPMAVVVSSTDRFLFSWVIPVLFVTIVLGGGAVLVLKAIAGWAARWTGRIRGGLYAGYGVELPDNLSARRARRKENKAKKKAERKSAEEVKEARAQRKADKIDAKQQVKEAVTTYEHL